MKAYIEKNWQGFIKISIADKDRVALPITFQKVPEATLTDPALELDMDSGHELLQSIVDQAWDMGIRPRYAKETTPELNALKYHLEDMRHLAFKGKKP